MKVIYLNEKKPPKEKTTLTVGTFDGVHRGHRKIIEQLVENAKETNSVSTLLTFHPHPRIVLQKNTNLKMLNTLDEKIARLEKYGLQQIVIQPFTVAFSKLSSEEYISQFLIEKLYLHKIIVGYDHRFGKSRSASTEDLIRFSEIYNFKVDKIPAHEIDTIKISSTKIRIALENGDIKKANQYLGYQYHFSGYVIKGKKIGSTIGFPTANIAIKHSYKLIPKNGAYLIKSTIDQKTYYGMLNIGYNPTVQSTSNKLKIEVHFFNLSQDLYNHELHIELLDKLRDEKKFANILALKKQLVLDKQTCFKLIKTL